VESMGSGARRGGNLMITVFRQPRVAQYVAQVYQNGYVSRSVLDKKIHSRNIYKVVAPYPTRKMMAALTWGQH